MVHDHECPLFQSLHTNPSLFYGYHQLCAILAAFPVCEGHASSMSGKVTLLEPRGSFDDWIL